MSFQGLLAVSSLKYIVVSSSVHPKSFLSALLLMPPWMHSALKGLLHIKAYMSDNFTIISLALCLLQPCSSDFAFFFPGTSNSACAHFPWGFQKHSCGISGLGCPLSSSAFWTLHITTASLLLYQKHSLSPGQSLKIKTQILSLFLWTTMTYLSS